MLYHREVTPPLGPPSFLILKTYSDLIAELSLLPQSGIAEVESQTPLPGPLKTHPSESTNEHSALYLLACISMRRLLNRVHHLLYADTASRSAASNDSRGEPFLLMVVELDHQLSRWRDSLPEYLRFSSDEGPVENEHQGFLRQRFLTCKCVIYRSYVEYELEHATDSAGGLNRSMQTKEACRMCLEASCFHIMNLRSYLTFLDNLGQSRATFIRIYSLALRNSISINIILFPESSL